MDATYIGLAQESLTPEEYLMGTSYIDAPYCSPQQLDHLLHRWRHYYVDQEAFAKRCQWSSTLKTLTPLTKSYLDISPIPPWLYCLEEALSAPSTIMNNNFTYTTPFIDYIVRNLSPLFTKELTEILVPYIDSILTHMAQDTVNHCYHRYQYEHRFNTTADQMELSFMKDFSHNLFDRLRAYPYLLRLLSTYTLQTTRHFNQFIERTLDSFTRRVISIRPYLSDLHHGFTSAIAFTLEDGGQYVYKPRPLDMEILFYDILDQLDPTITYRPKILSYPSYGYMEFISPLPCDYHHQVSKYFYNAGKLAALIQHLQGTDFHHENVIARGHHPVFIDLETLSHPHVHFEKPTSPLQRTGLGDCPYSAFDLEPSIKKNSLPHFNDCYHGRLEYLDDFNTGFETMNSLLIHQKTFLSHYLSILEKVNSRVIIRATSVYEKLLLDSLHPDYLTSGLNRSLYFEGLFASATKEEIMPNWFPLLELEKKQLVSCNIPYISKEQYYHQCKNR